MNDRLERMKALKRILCAGSVTADVLVTPADSVPTPGTLRAVEGVSTHVGGCAANAYHTTGSITGVYDLGCQLHKKRIECAIMLKVAEMEEGL